MFTPSRISKINVSQLGRGLFGKEGQCVWVFFFAVAGLGLIIWAFLAAWDCSRWVNLPIIQNTNVCPSFTGNLSPLIVAMGFWLVGLLNYFNRQKHVTSTFYLLISGILSSGLLSSMGNDGGGRIFFILIAWLAPFLIRFHKTLSENEPGPIYRVFLLVFYLLAILESLPWLFLKPTALKEYGVLNYVDIAVRGILILSILAALYVAIQDYQGVTILSAKRKLRLVVFGTVLGFPPLVLLSLVPNTLRMGYDVPYSFTFPFLLLGPTLYLYSVYRFRLVWLEEIIQRSVAYYLLLILLGSLTLYLANFLIWQDFSFDTPTHVWILIVAFVTFSLVSVPSWKAFHRLSYWVLYGDSNRVSCMIERMAVALSNVLDPKGFYQAIYEELSNIWPVSSCAIFTKNESGHFCCAYSVGLNQDTLAKYEFSEDGPLARYLGVNREVLEPPRLLKSLKRHGTSLSEKEMNLLLTEDIALWVPLVSDHKLQGLLFLGPCQPENYLTTEERRFLRSLIFQGGGAINKLYLDSEVLRRRQELDQAYRRLVFARDEERRRLARELHDQIIQPLAVHHYALSKLEQRTENDPEQLSSLQKEISTMIRVLRNLCVGLRPPVLDTLGLAGALQSLVDEFKKQTDTQILFNLDENQVEGLPDGVELCAFRVLQEALVNVQKHAQARLVEVSLRIAKTELDLIVEDDGKGFIIPDRIECFTQQSCFGLSGLKERAELIGGNLEIFSVPGHGCQLFLQIPLSLANSQKPDLSKGGGSCLFVS